MKLLFEMDRKDYGSCTRRFVRNSARSIIIRDGKIAMIHSLKYDYFKFPGGGIENGEDPVEAVIRETREEAGIVIRPETVRAYGYVHRIQRSDTDASECFVQDNYYYLCEAEPDAVAQKLDAYEAQEAFTLEYVAPMEAIQKNRSAGGSPCDPVMLEREAKVLELLISEDFFSGPHRETPQESNRESKPDLEGLYHQIDAAISSLDFSRIWPGFRPLKFALYDDRRCFFDGHYVEKTDAFCANTSIVYRSEQIAIWMVQQELEIPVFASKIVHEMFHGYQSIMGWDCRVNELEALQRYEYKAENLSLKLRENELLLDLLDAFDESALAELLAHRKRRSLRFPYEFTYESKVEEIEGTANYVEWQVLKQLDESASESLTAHMREVITKPEYLFPIRISGYYTGALMINALRAAGLYSFEPSARSEGLSVLARIAPSDGDFAGKADLTRRTEDAVHAFYAETEAIIQSALGNNQVVLNGPAELKGVNFYNARFRNGFLTSTYFLLYREGAEDRLLQGNFVIRMQDEHRIAAVYRWV